MFKVSDRRVLLQTAISNLANNSSIANLSPGSKARAIIEATSTVVGGVAEDLSLGMLRTLLTNAEGLTLDLLAEMAGIQRNPEIHARVESTDQNLKYYVRTGTFGDINNGSGFTVPAGTEIKVATRGLGNAVFIQREDVIAPAGANEVYFAADQKGTVNLTGIAPAALKLHNFTGYSDATFGSLLVVNTRGVAGRPRETDQNLRFRISNQIAGNAEANLTAIRISALQVPGVSDIRIIKNASGIGTFEVVVFGISPVVSDSVIAEVQEQIDMHQAVGTAGIAVASHIVGLSLSIRLTFKDDASTGDKSAAAAAAQAAVREQVKDINAGETFVVNTLVKSIINAHQSILDIGDPARPFDELLVWRSSSLLDNRYSRILNGNLVVKEDEELVIEPYLETPISITEA